MILLKKNLIILMKNEENAEHFSQMKRKEAPRSLPFGKLFKPGFPSNSLPYVLDSQEIRIFFVDNHNQVLLRFYRECRRLDFPPLKIFCSHSACLYAQLIIIYRQGCQCTVLDHGFCAAITGIRAASVILSSCRI